MSYEVLKKAIETRQSLTTIYDYYLRDFTPHILGTSIAGHSSVLCYQYGGGRDGGLPAGGAWCVFTIALLGKLEINDDKWVTGPIESKPLHLLAAIDFDGSDGSGRT